VTISPMTSDEIELPELTRRQEEILYLIVTGYTTNPEPISSKHLVETYDLNFSSATIRNEMAVLEEKGYIKAPHTSAGRSPTENGYRYFVQRLLKTTALSTTDQTRITEKLQGFQIITEQWMRLAASILARTAQSAALVTPPIAETSHFKHLELIAIQGRVVLMVLVLNSGSVHQQMLNLAEPVPQPVLSSTAQNINDICMSLTAEEVRLKAAGMRLLEREIIELIADLMTKADSNQARFIYRDGLSEIINAFEPGQGAQQAVRVFEERGYLNMVLNEVLQPESNNVKVLIAGDGRWEELKHLTMVVSRYGIPRQVSGAVGVIGPTHLNYSRAISTVQYVSRLMTEMLTELYGDSENTPESPEEDPNSGPPPG
jgi:heat-inducible transcriptional repressor